MEKQKRAYFYAAAAVLLWATVATAFKISLQHLDPLQLLFYSCLFSTAILFIVLALQGKLHLLKTCTKRDLFRSALLGLLNPFLYYIVLFNAYSLLPAQHAQPINMTWPIVLVLLSVPILRQKISLMSVLAMLVSFFGVYILSTRGNILGFKPENPLGVALALGSTVLWALFWIYNVKDRRDEVLKLFLNFAFGCAFVAVPLLLFSKIDLADTRGLLCAAYVGLFEMGITFVLWLKALKLSRTTAKVSNLIYISPFLSLIPIHFIVGEKIYISSVLGLVFIVAGVLLQQFAGRTARPSK